MLNFTSDELSFRTLAAIFLEVKRKGAIERRHCCHISTFIFSVACNTF